MLHMLPQCPLLADKLINTFQPEALYDDTCHPEDQQHACLLSITNTPPPYPMLYSPFVSSLPILHQDQHHFHTNYHCRGNWPKEVITQVMSVTDDERLAAGQVFFIRGQVDFAENTVHVCYTCTKCQSAALSARGK